MTSQDGAPTPAPEIGRNEPCPCGSGKKYKRCHGVGAAPKLTTPKVAGPGGMTPEQAQQMMAGVDPEWIGKVQAAMQRLPRGQMQRLQSVMQRAMAGKDVSQESAELERVLPPEFRSLMAGAAQMMGAAQGQAAAGANAAGAMDADAARAIVEQAVKEGRLSEDQAKDVLAGAPAPQKSGGLLKKLGLK